MAKKSEDLERELVALKARINEQKRREQEAGEHELLKLVRRADCLQAALAWARRQVGGDRKSQGTEGQADAS